MNFIQSATIFKPQQQSKKAVLQLLSSFIFKFSKHTYGYQTQIFLKIQYVGNIYIEGNKILFYNHNIKWTAYEKKNKIHKLPTIIVNKQDDIRKSHKSQAKYTQKRQSNKLLTKQSNKLLTRQSKILLKQQLKRENRLVDSNIIQMSHKFSSSLTKSQQKSEGSLKRMGSLKNIQLQSQQNQISQQSKLQKQRKHALIRQRIHTQMDQNQQRSNRILKLKHETQEMNIMKNWEQNYITGSLDKVGNSFEKVLLNKHKQQINTKTIVKNIHNNVNKTNSRNSKINIQINNRSNQKQFKTNQNKLLSLANLRPNKLLQNNSLKKNDQRSTPDKNRSQLISNKKHKKQFNTKNILTLNKNQKKLKLNNNNQNKQKYNLLNLNMKYQQNHQKYEQNDFSNKEIFSHLNTQGSQQLLLNSNFQFESGLIHQQKINRQQIYSLSKDKNFNIKFSRYEDMKLLQKKQTKTIKKHQQMLKMYKLNHVIDQIKHQFPQSQKPVQKMMNQFLKICSQNKGPYQKKNQQLQLKNPYSNRQGQQTFDQFFNKKLAQKIYIQQQKVKQLNQFKQTCRQSYFNVKKIVYKFQKQYNIMSDNISNMSMGNISSLNHNNKQLLNLMTTKIFKTKAQQQKIKMIFEKIRVVQKKFKNVYASNYHDFKWSLQKKYQKTKFNSTHKNYVSIETINIFEIGQKIKNLFNTIDSMTSINLNHVRQRYSQERQYNQVKKQIDKIGPQMALRLRQLYFVLQSYFFFVIKQKIMGTKKITDFQFIVNMKSFNKISAYFSQIPTQIKVIFSKIQQKIKFYHKVFKIQQFQKKKLYGLVQQFQQFLQKKVFQSQTFRSRYNFYIQKISFIFQPMYYLDQNKMRQQTKKLDEIYQSNLLEEQQKFVVENVLVDITQAKCEFHNRIRIFLIQLQNNYETLYLNQIALLDRMLRVSIEIKPEMLFQQNFLKVKNSYLTKLYKIQNLFSFILQRRFIYLSESPKQLKQILSKFTKKRDKLNSYLQNLDNRLADFKKKMQDQICYIQNLNKNLKENLKQLNAKLKKLINELKDQKDILTNSTIIAYLNNQFQNYKKQKDELVKRMQMNQIIYWQDDDFFQKNVKLLILSLDFLRSDIYKLIYQSNINQIQWNTFNLFYQKFSLLMDQLGETKLYKIFKVNYEYFRQNLQFIQVVLYKGYTNQQLQRLNQLQVRISRQYHTKLMNLLKKVINIDKKNYQETLSIFRRSKQNEFYKIKIEKLMNLNIVFFIEQQLTLSLKQYVMWKIRDLSNIYEDIIDFHDKKADEFIRIIEKFKIICHQLIYFKKTLIHLNQMTQEQKVQVFEPLYNKYIRIVNKFKCQQKLQIAQFEIDQLYESVSSHRARFLNVFFNQKVRFFPRISLLNTDTIIECFYWNSSRQIQKNIQNLLQQVDEVIFTPDRKVKQLRLGNDFIIFQKQLDPLSMQGIQFLKLLYAHVQGLIQDSVTESLNRLGYIKIICWIIYSTQQIECSFITKTSFTEIKSRIQTIIKEITEQLRYDIYQHHKGMEISQLKILIQFIDKLMKTEDPENSFLWSNSLKMYQRNKKIIISQNNYQYEFGYQPKKAYQIQPHFQLQRAIKYALLDSIEFYKTSAYITGRPFIQLDIINTVLNNKPMKLLDIIYKLNFFVVIDHGKIFSKLGRNQASRSFLKFTQNNFLHDQKQDDNKQNNKLNLIEYQRINNFHRQLLYFADFKRELEGVDEIKLPILMKYTSLASIPAIFKSQDRILDRPSKLFSIQLVILIRLNKYQLFFTQYNISINKISLFFKELNDQFSMSYEKLNKILNDFQVYIQKMSRQNKQKVSIQNNKRKNYTTSKSGLINEEQKNNLMINTKVSRFNNMNNNNINDQMTSQQKQQSCLNQNNNSYRQSKKSSSNQLLQLQQQDQILNQFDSISHSISQQFPKRSKHSQKNSQFSNQLTKNNDQQSNSISREMFKNINKQIFKILIHYYPQREVEITKIMKQLVDSQDKKSYEEIIQNAIENAKINGKSVIVYGEMSHKTSSIKKFLKYGKNLQGIKILGVNQNINNVENLKINQTKEQKHHYQINTKKNLFTAILNQITIVDTNSLEIGQKVQIYYLQGLKNYFQLKNNCLKFLVQTQSIDQITPTQITQTLIYFDSLTLSNIERHFKQRMKQIFYSSQYSHFYRSGFQNDCWISFENMNQIYMQCGGSISISTKIDIFLNVLQKEFHDSKQQKSKKKIDCKILLKQIIIMIFEIYIYSLDIPQRKIFIEEGRKKKYFNLTELKGINLQDLYNFTTVNLQTQKIQQLIKRQKFSAKNIFPIQRQITLIKKYMKLQQKYSLYLLDLLQQHQKNQTQQQKQIRQLQILTNSLKNIHFMFITSNSVINKSLSDYFKQQFMNQFKQFKKFISNKKILSNLMKKNSLSNKKKDYIKFTNKTLCVIQDLHLTIDDQYQLLKILIDHYAEYSNNVYYTFFMNKNSLETMSSKDKKYLEIRPAFVFKIGQINFQTIFKYQVKNAIHQNTIQKTRKLKQNGYFSSQLNYLSFIMDYQVKLPAQIFQKYYFNCALISKIIASTQIKQHQYCFESNLHNINKSLIVNMNKIENKMNEKQKKSSQRLKQQQILVQQTKQIKQIEKKEEDQQQRSISEFSQQNSSGIQQISSNNILKQQSSQQSAQQQFNIQPSQSLQKLRDLKNFNKLIQTTILTFNKLFNMNYKQSIIIKKKTFIELNQSQIDKILDKFISIFHHIQEQANKSGVVLSQKRDQLDLFDNKNIQIPFLRKFLIKNHLKKYLNLVLSEKYYIIQEQIIYLPYMIAYLQQKKLYILDEVNNFILKFIEILQKQSKKFMNNIGFNQICILIKPPLSVSNKFIQFINLIVKKASYLQFYQQFLIFLQEQKAKTQFISNSHSSYQKKILDLYQMTFNHSKIIISVKACHKNIFKNDNYDQLTKIQKIFTYNIKKNKISKVNSTRLTKRESLINRQLKKKDKNKQEINMKMYIDEQTSCINKIGNQFWQNMVYINANISNEDKLTIIDQLFIYHNEKIKKNYIKIVQNTNTIHLTSHNNNSNISNRLSQEQLKHIKTKQLLDTVQLIFIQILKTIIQTNNISIDVIDNLIQEVIEYMYGRNNEQNYKQLKLFYNTIEIDQIIYDIKQKIQTQIHQLESRNQSKNIICEYLLSRIQYLKPSDYVVHNKSFKQINEKLKELEEEERWKINLPSRKVNKKRFYLENSQRISKIKQQFYEVQIADLQNLISIIRSQQNQLKSLKKQKQYQNQNINQNQQKDMIVYMKKLFKFNQINKQHMDNNVNFTMKNVSFKDFSQQHEQQPLLNCLKLINQQLVPNGFNWKFVIKLIKYKQTSSKKNKKSLQKKLSIELKQQDIKLKKNNKDKLKQIKSTKIKQQNNTKQFISSNSNFNFTKSKNKFNGNIVSTNISNINTAGQPNSTSNHTLQKTPSSNKFLKNNIKQKQRSECADEIQQIQQQIQTTNDNKNQLTKFLNSSTNDFILNCSSANIFDVIFHRYLTFILEIYKEYDLDRNEKLLKQSIKKIKQLSDQNNQGIDLNNQKLNNFEVNDNKMTYNNQNNIINNETNINNKYNNITRINSNNKTNNNDKNQTNNSNQKKLTNDNNQKKLTNNNQKYMNNNEKKNIANNQNSSSNNNNKIHKQQQNSQSDDLNIVSIYQQQQQFLSLKSDFIKQLKQIQYFLVLDLLTLQKDYVIKYQQKLKQNRKNLQLIEQYINICLLTNHNNKQKDKQKQKQNKQIKQNKQARRNTVKFNITISNNIQDKKNSINNENNKIKQQNQIKNNNDNNINDANLNKSKQQQATEQKPSILSLELRNYLYQIIYMNILCHIKQNGQLNKLIKNILQITGQQFLIPSLSNLSKNKLNLTPSQYIQIKYLQQKNKFIISDPYNQFNYLIKNIKSQCYFINQTNFDQVKKFRFKIIFYCFYLESVEDYYQKKALINKVDQFITEKIKDSKSYNQKIVLLASNQKIINVLDLQNHQYIKINLDYSFIKFNQSINKRKMKLSRQQSQNLVQSYMNAYSKLYDLSTKIIQYSIQQKNRILQILDRQGKQVIHKFLILNNNLQELYMENNVKNLSEDSDIKCKLVYQYLNQLIEAEIIPYRYIKRIHSKLDWFIIEQKIQSIINNKKNMSQQQRQTLIKQYLGKQLLQLRCENFIQQFKQSINFSNCIIIIYDVLQKRIFKQIRTVSDNQKIDFKLFFQFSILQKKDFLIDIDELESNKQVNNNIQTKQSLKKFNQSNKKLNNTHKNLLKTYNSIQDDQEIEKSYTKLNNKKRKNNDQSFIDNEFNKRKNIYFVHEKEIYKIKDVFHICSIIYV